MKKRIIKFSPLAFLLILIFINVSCGGRIFVLKKTFDIELHDENNGIISKKEDLENFELSQIDNYTGSKFYGEISLEQVSDHEYCYGLFFNLGRGSLASTEEQYERKFNKQTKKTGIRIVDKTGKYKACEVYPLSDYNTDKYVNQIVVKLEKK